MRETRRTRVIAPLLGGEILQQEDCRPDDVSYIQDLGLVQVAPNGSVDITNAIYREIIPRELALPGFLPPALRALDRAL